MSFKIIPTPSFERELKQLAKKYSSLKKDISALAAQLSETPQMGTPLGHDCYKIRLSITSKGKGKSGGARVITHVQIIDENIFLLAIYDKSQAESSSPHQQLFDLRFDRRRFRHRRKTFHGFAIFIDQEFGKIPFDPAAEPSPQSFLEIPEQRMRPRAVDLDLLEQGKAHPVIQLTRFLHHLVSQRFLAPKLITRKTQDHQPPVFIGSI